MTPSSVFYYDSLDSTNEEAKRLLNAGKIQQPVTIVAKTQTAGKGTRGRQWISPTGTGLYVSFIHPQEMTGAGMPLAPWYTLGAGVACAEVLQAKTDLPVQLKPINDLYLFEGKLGGILTESIVREGQCRALITGVGINILAHPEIEDHALQTGNLPTCLAAHLPHKADPNALMDALVPALGSAIDFWYGQLLAGEVAMMLEHYRGYKLPGYELPELSLL